MSVTDLLTGSNSFTLLNKNTQEYSLLCGCDFLLRDVRTQYVFDNSLKPECRRFVIMAAAKNVATCSHW